MSAAADSINRPAWRTSNSHRQQPSRTGSGASTPSQSSLRQPTDSSQTTTSPAPVAAPAPTTNAWTSHARSASAVRAPISAQSARQVSVSPGPNGTGAGPTATKSTPLNGFNSNEIEDMFRRVHTRSVGQDAAKATYRPTGGAPVTKSTGVWGAKPSASAMSGGQDFFRELAKQVASTEKGEQGRGG